MLAAKLLASTGGAAAPGLQWQSRFLRDSINGIAWSNTLGIYAAVGRLGSIFTSLDGIVWTQRTSSTTTTLTDIVWTGTAFVAAGGTVAVRSTDGISWTTTATSMGNPNSIAASGSVVVTVGLLGSYRRSTNDGVTFTTTGSTGSATLNGIVWASNFSVFVAVGGTDIRTSPDGVTWTVVHTVSGRVFDSVAFDSSAGRLVAVATTGETYASSNSVTWALANSIGVTVTVQDVTFGNGLFTLVSSVGGAIYTTPNPVTTAWTQRLASSPKPLFAVLWNDFQYIAVGSGFTVYTSATGSSWVSQNTGTLNTLNGVTDGADVLVAAGDSGTIVTSPNGVDWTVRTSGTTNKLNAAAWASSLGMFVVVGDSDTILYSTDAISWSTTSTAYGESLKDVVWDGSTFWAVSSASNKVFKSFDGANWNLSAMAGVGSASSIASDGGSRLVIAKATGDVAYSDDGGIFWNTAARSGTLYNVSWTGSLFILTGSGGTIYTSTTGATWTARTSGISQPLFASAAVDAMNVVVLGGLNPVAGAIVAVSSVTNTVSWFNAPTNNGDTFNGATYYGTIGRYIAVGLNGQIALSAPITSLVRTI